MRPLRFRSRSAIPISRGCRQPKRRFIEAFQKVDEIAGRKEGIRRFADIKLDGAGVWGDRSHESRDDIQNVRAAS